MAAGTDELLRRRKSSSAILASARKQSDCADQQANRSPLTVLGHKNSPEIRFRAFQVSKHVFSAMKVAVLL